MLNIIVGKNIEIIYLLVRSCYSNPTICHDLRHLYDRLTSHMLRRTEQMKSIGELTATTTVGYVLGCLLRDSRLVSAMT